MQPSELESVKVGGDRGLRRLQIWAKIKWGFLQPGWLSGLAPPLAQGQILESWDGVPHRAPCMEPASLSACVSVSVCVPHE